MSAKIERLADEAAAYRTRLIERGMHPTDAMELTRTFIYAQTSQEASAIIRTLPPVVRS